MPKRKSAVMDFTKTEKTPIYLPQTHTTVTAIHTCSYANSVDFCANPNALKELASHTNMHWLRPQSKSLKSRTLFETTSSISYWILKLSFWVMFSRTGCRARLSHAATASLKLSGKCARLHHLRNKVDEVTGRCWANCDRWQCFVHPVPLIITHQTRFLYSKTKQDVKEVTCSG